jgi:hypothetical protein
LVLYEISTFSAAGFTAIEAREPTA